MVFLGLVLNLLGALNYYDNHNHIWNQIGSPLDPAFYGSQLIGLIAACLVPYVQALPKKQ